MAYGAEPAGAGALAHTIYVRPSGEIIAQSWQWPASWHEAFEQTMAEIALAAVTCILEDIPVTGRPISLQFAGACVAFRIEREASRTYIAVLMFTGPESGPDAPGPNGGCQQPRAAHGLVLGLRGSGRNFQLVVFQGYMPAIPGPARNVLSLRLFERAILKGVEKDYIVHSVVARSNAARPNSPYLNRLFPYSLGRPSRAVRASRIDPSAAVSDGRAARDPAAKARTTPWPNLWSHPDWPTDIHQLFQRAFAMSASYRWSTAPGDTRYLDKLRISVWGTRTRTPLCDFLPSQYLH